MAWQYRWPKPKTDHSKWRWESKTKVDYKKNRREAAKIAADLRELPPETALRIIKESEAYAKKMVNMPWDEYMADFRKWKKEMGMKG